MFGRPHYSANAPDGLGAAEVQKMKPMRATKGPRPRGEFLAEPHGRGQSSANQNKNDQQRL